MFVTRPLVRFFLIAFAALASLAVCGQALASGGSYALDGGTSRERAQVRAALDVSAFDWDLVPATIRIHVRRGVESRAAPGEIWLDANLLDSGRYSWGFVQHEYAHQVDFYDLDDADRELLNRPLGDKEWWLTTPGIAHADLGCERFASTLAWAFWPSNDNALRPFGPNDESAGMQPTRFRALLSELLGGKRQAYSLR